jgi:Leucine-rich repeat (LRR) protein
VYRTGVKVVSVFGDHNATKSNKDVLVFSNQFTKTTHLPQGIGLVFPRLTRFFVVASKLKFIARRNFVGLTRLRILDLRFNEIETIPDDVFLDLFSLEVLTMSGNQLKSLPTNCFVTMLSLRYFDASDNSIESFNDEIFVQNENLQEILLEHNKIATIAANFTRYKDIGFIDLRDNVCVQDKFYLRGFPNLLSLDDFQESINEHCEDARNEIVKRSTRDEEMRVLQWDICPRMMPAHMKNLLCLIERKFKLN